MYYFFFLIFILFSCSEYHQSTREIEQLNQLELIEHVKKNNDMTIAYKTYRLKNGLTLILHEDHSDPIVHVDVTYHVGSARENIGYSGFAHLFEHLMFEGSKHVKNGEHFKIITESGGSLNATTSSDKTSYYQTVPKNILETVLWLESDRMGFFYDTVTQQAFDVQLKVVKNEKKQNYDNRPYGLFYTVLHQALYPNTHPYSWPTIGWQEDLDRSQLKDLQQFFLHWYVPNNATLTIGGDINELEVLQLVHHYFSPISKKHDVEPLTPSKVVLSRKKYITLEDDIHVPVLNMTVPTVYLKHKDAPKIDILMRLLGKGKYSLLEKKFVETGIVLEKNAYHSCRELSCYAIMNFFIDSQNSYTLKDIEKMVYQVIDEYIENDILESDIQDVITQLEAEMIYNKQSLSDKVSTLAYYQALTNDPNYQSILWSRYQDVTIKDIKKVYRKYLKNKNNVVLSVVPRGQELLSASYPNFNPVRNTNFSSFHDILTYQPVVDHFDRNKAPKYSLLSYRKLPEIWKKNVVSNQVPILGMHSIDNPITELLFVFEGGKLLTKKNMSGVSELTNNIMSRSTVKLDTVDFYRKLEQLGIEIKISSDLVNTYVSVSCLSKYLNEAISLLQERLFQNRFDEVEFEQEKHKLIQEIKSKENYPSYLAKRTWNSVVYGQDNPIFFASGNVKSVNNIELKDVKDFYQQQFITDNLYVVVVSDLPKQNVLKSLSFLNKWKRTYQDIGLPSTSEQVGKPNVIYFVDRKNSVQSAIYIGKTMPKYDALGTYFKLKLANYTLGGMFNSRLNLNLREDKGYTYGIRSALYSDRQTSEFLITTDVKSEHTAESVDIILSELSHFHQEGLTISELLLTKKAILQSQALDFETIREKIMFLSRIQTYQLPFDFTKKQRKIIDNVTNKQLKSLIKQHFDPKDMFIVVIGDKMKVYDELKKLDLPIVELTNEITK